jgi:hypothetical protein
MSKNERINVMISFWKLNQNVLVSFSNLSCWEQIVSIWSRICYPGPNKNDLFRWGSFKFQEQTLLVSFLLDVGTFVERLFLYCFDYQGYGALKNEMVRGKSEQGTDRTQWLYLRERGFSGGHVFPLRFPSPALVAQDPKIRSRLLFDSCVYCSFTKR